MKTYLIQSHDEMNDIEVTGSSLTQAIELAKETSFKAVSFFEEYNLEDCYVEELES